MQRTLKEKYNYNKSKDGRFSSGYCMGVDLYKDYFKQNAKGKAEYKQLIGNAKISAKNGSVFEKGLMCGVRDAANARKQYSKR